MMNRKKQVDEIDAQSHEKILSLMQQIETIHQEIAAIKKDDEQKIREILQEKQQIKFDKIREQFNK